MRKTTILVATLVAALGLSACSEKTQDSAATTAESAGDDAQAVGAAAGEAAADGANAVGNAADKAAASTDELGTKAENARATMEADAHNESVEEAKRD